eukprot:SAG31_NODE_2046_length_6572_cov_5.058396_1_plen_162_part_00
MAQKGPGQDATNSVDESIAGSSQVGDGQVQSSALIARPVSLDEVVQRPDCAKADVAAWLQPRSTLLADVNGVLSWLSLRSQGNKAQKIQRILRALDGWPNLVRLAVQCYLAREEEPHVDRHLLEDITKDARSSLEVNEDGLLHGDLLFDADIRVVAGFYYF